MKLYLLTHERELNKLSNTGRLVKECLGVLVEIIIWKRTEPDSNLIELINKREVAMLYPDQPSQNSKNYAEPEGVSLPENALLTKKASLNDFESFLILDSTWQEARKMYNRSTYLQQVKKISLQVDTPSTYRKRRNQIEGGLSTAECVIALLKQKNEFNLAEALQKDFDVFNLG
jgi:DTW domain-containing protein YfiP